MDFDPRDFDPRDRDGRDRDDDRVYGWSEDPRDRDPRERVVFDGKRLVRTGVSTHAFK